MTLPKKGSRTIKVAGQEYKWMVSRSHLSVVIIEGPGGVESVTLPSPTFKDGAVGQPPVTPADVEACIRHVFLDQEGAELPSYQSRVKRWSKEHPAPKRLMLPISKAQVLRVRSGMDHVILEIDPSLSKQILIKAVGKQIAEEVLNNQLFFETRVTKGKGEDLVQALGLEVDEVIGDTGNDETS